MANAWHERFLAGNYVYGKEPNEFVVEAAQVLPEGAKVLCIAEGEGRNSVYLASLDHQVTAWDYAPAGLEKTKQLANERDVVVHAELRDLADVSWEDEQCDAIVHIFCHFPKDIMNKTLTGIQKSLKKGGYYISELYTTEQLGYGTGGPKDKALLINPKDMLAHFEGYFIQHFYVGEVTRVEGELHTGAAHVVQSIFKKRNEEL